MYDFVLQTTFFLSIGVMIYLIARAVPRIPDSGDIAHHAPGRFDAFLRKLPLRELDERIHRASERLLRRVRVIVLKIDNALDRSLNRLKRLNNNTETEERQKQLFDDEPFM